MWAIVKKEFKSYFLSPIGYIYIGIFLIMSSVVFYTGMFVNGYLQFSTLYTTCITILAFIVPVLTMRMFSEERKTGTEQLLLTSPQSVTQIVLGKFLGAGFVMVISVVSTFLFYIILSFFGDVQFVETIVAMLGVVMVSFAFLSFGMFASSLTESQLIAALISIGFFLLISYLPIFISSLTSFSLTNAATSFLNGTIALKDVVCLLSFTIMFILFTMMSIQRRKNLK